MWRWITLIVLLLPGGCGMAGTAPPAEQRFAGWLAGCGESSAATLTRIGDSVAFAPADGVLVLRGTVAADGGFTARLNTQPPGKPAFLLTASGMLTADAAAVRYATPRCPLATATLARVRPSLF
jgi:hypothetical protein